MAVRSLVLFVWTGFTLFATSGCNATGPTQPVTSTNSASSTGNTLLPVAAPGFSFGSGAYYSPFSLAISSSTAGTSIYFTSNGATPTASSRLYSGLIPIQTSCVIKAVAVRTNGDVSGVSTATYTLIAVMGLTSTAFNNNTVIPQKYSGNYNNVIPSLSWTGAPAGTQSFAITVDDPDAPGGNWVHYVVFNIAPAVLTLPENGTPASPAVIGKNSWGYNSYIGPAPPSGQTHRYYFNVYALDTTLGTLASSAVESDLLAAMQDHILAKGVIMGTYTSP